MKKNLFFGLALALVLAVSIGAQSSTGSEDELKTKAKTLFEAQNFKEAKLIYAQLLSLYPKDPTYNYRFGACVLQTEADKTKPMKYLEFAASKNGVDPLAYFYLGKAFHLNYDFAQAVKQYSRFKSKATGEEKDKYQVDRQIEMCKNGNSLLAKLNEVQVIERQTISKKDFYRIYDENSIGGRIIVQPEEFQSKFDKKQGERSIIFLPKDAKEVYYSSYGKKGENGKDIFKAVKLGSGEWSEGVSLGSSINTKFDEDYAYIKPDGRTLYFASKGHSSMGGYDIFKSVLDEATGQWTEPENLDFAFNSADDDFMFITDQAEVTAYFASNRANEFGDVTVYKVLTERAPAELSVISGTFVAESNPAQKEAQITVIDKLTQETVGIYKTDEKGNYAIEIAKNGGEYQFNVETNETDPIHTGVVSIPKQDEFEVLGQELRLVGSGNEQQLVIKNIFDGTAVNSITEAGRPSISSELIKKKANLEVNFNQNDLVAIQQNNAEGNSEDNEQKKVDSETNDSIEEVVLEEENSSESEVIADEIIESNEVAELDIQSIKEELSELVSQANTQIDGKQNAVNAQYAAAYQMNQEAKNLFEKAAQLENENAEVEEINQTKREAGEKALQASMAAQLAIEIEESINTDLNTLNAIENSQSNIENAVKENDQTSVGSILDEIRSMAKNGTALEEIVENSRERLREGKALADKKISDFSSKLNSFQEEQNSLINQLENLKTEKSKAKGKKLNEVEKSVEATELDLKDLNYQSEVVSKNLLDAKLSKQSAALEDSELTASLSRFENKSENQKIISEVEKNTLFDELKLYRESNQLAFTSDNELYQTGEDLLTDNVNAAVVNPITEDVEDETTSIQETNDAEFEELDEVSENIDENSIKGISAINANYKKELLALESIEDEELQLANKITVYNKWLANLNEGETITREVYDSEIDETKRSELQSELDDFTASIRTTQQSKDKAELELAKRASGEFVADVQIVNTINDISETTVVNSDFTSLKFDQTLQPTTAATANQLIDAKKALYEAGMLSKQQKAAQESAYSLPTAAERTLAFDEANQLKKQSEQKQMEAAEKFAAFNLKEYQANKLKIQEANQLDARFNTEGRQIAELLAEEANSFFTDAAILRSEIDANDRLSQKEVNLQKAYDYELLAIKKQKQAIEKLGLVVSEVITAKTGNAPSRAKRPFIQIIEDESILAVVEAPKAKAKAETLSATVITIDEKIEAEENIADNMEEGAARDSVIDVLNKLDEERELVLKEAALYYERERQIKAGLVGVESKKVSHENQVLTPSKPAFTVLLDSVDVNGEREELLLNSQSFKDFANNRQALVTQTNLAQVSYEEAIALAEENSRLTKQAVIETNMAKAVKDENEKQRLIKSAKVIESKIQANEAKIEKINQTIKVKNFLLQSLTEKDNAYLAKLGEVEKQEYIALSEDFVPEIEPVTANIPVNETNLNDVEETISTTLESEETAENFEELEKVVSTSDDLILPEGVEVDETEDEIIEDIQTEDPNRSEQPISETEVISEEVQEVVEEIKIEETDEFAPSAVNNQLLEKADVMKTIDVVPREVKQAIFVTLNKNESAYSEAKPIPTKTSLPQGVVYKVQIGAFRNKIPANTFKGFAPLMAEQAGTGITRYTAGLFANENTATAARNEIRKIGYPDAFVVAFLNGERISISAARGKTGEAPAANTATANFTKVESSGSSYTSTGNTSVATSTEVTQVAGGSKEALPEVFNSENVEEVVNTKTVEGLYYTIQIGVFSTPIKKGVFTYEGLNVVQLSSGLYRYNAGMFESVLAAAELKNEISATITDAFVCAYYNGERISLTEASKLKGE